MSALLWLKRLERKHRNTEWISDEDYAEFIREQERIFAHLQEHPLPPPTDEDLARIDAAIDEANEKGWIPSHPKTGLPIEWMRIFIPNEEPGRLPKVKRLRIRKG